MLLDLVKKNRSYRRFDASKQIEKETLNELVNLARFSASAANLQNLRFYLSATSETNDVIFSNLKWAGYLTEWDGPEENEQPTGYIIILSDKDKPMGVKWNTGIAAQTILLGAVEKGLGGCMFGAVNKENLIKKLQISDHYEIELVIALGVPVEDVVIEEVIDNNIKYWRDESNVHHVPKKKLNDLIIG